MAHAAGWQAGNNGTPVCGLRSWACSDTDLRTRFVAGATSPDTVYFGGGTPSLLPADGVRRIMTALRALGVTGADECTFEVNPDDIVRSGVEYVRTLLEAGINRVSMGVQSLDDGILHWMGRRHDAACARTAFGILRAAGVRNISVDLIFGLPQLSEKQLLSTIDGVLSLGPVPPEHISAYQLSVEEDSTLAQMLADGLFVEASDEQCRRQYDILCSRLRDAGYNHYEISNWARPGAEAVHNSAYWQRVPYIGLGPGAHSFSIGADSPEVAAHSSSIGADSSPFSVSSAISSDFDVSSIVPGPGALSIAPVHSGPSFASGHCLEKRSWNTHKILEYASETEELTYRESAEEIIFLSLRTSAGIDECVLEGLLGGEDCHNETRQALSRYPNVTEELIDEGALVRDGGRIRIPEDHFFVSDDIILRLVESLEL